MAACCKWRETGNYFSIKVHTISLLGFKLSFSSPLTRSSAVGRLCLLLRDIFNLDKVLPLNFFKPKRRFYRGMERVSGRIFIIFLSSSLLEVSCELELGSKRLESSVEYSSEKLKLRTRFPSFLLLPYSLFSATLIDAIKLLFCSSVLFSRYISFCCWSKGFGREPKCLLWSGNDVFWL
jgi:hypothetical protein